MHDQKNCRMQGDLFHNLKVKVRRKDNGNDFVIFLFEKFPVFQLAVKICVQVCDHIVTNKTIDIHTRDQMHRATTSVVFNIAEGTGKFSRKDKKNFYTIARGSANESAAAIIILKEKRLLTEFVFNNLYQDLETVCKMLSGLINSLDDSK